MPQVSNPPSSAIRTRRRQPPDARDGGRGTLALCDGTAELVQAPSGDWSRARSHGHHH
ncbi:MULTISPECIES: hypothetical protein [unclassified Streptomyces]|uniref:hypothetical protein n=1 Tax=unclassified Streptomyces TaxID=2593676 RepID=UPI0016604E9D|nr:MULTISPECIES: hypothetical protein [unclassified Streptomyces]